MKVTVTDFLNVRVGKASLNAPTYQYLAPGTILEVEDATFNGDVFEGSNQWLKDKAGNYYWAGATTYSVAGTINPACYDAWHLRDHHIKAIHDKGFKGKGVTVCIVDTGIVATHPGFDYTKISGKGFLNQIISTDIKDDHGHGTKCAGIVAANGKEVVGIACEADLTVFRGYSYSRSKEADMIYALENIPLDTDVVSISYVFADTKLLNRLTAAVARLIGANIIVVAAHGNTDTLPNLMSSITGVISVGAVDENGEYAPYTCAEGTFTVLAPGSGIRTTSPKNYSSETGTSFAAPFIASVCALLKQTNKTIGPAEALEFINNNHTLSKDGSKKIIDPAGIIK
ncbi:S8 family peptidase [Fluviicola sp.]|uniref:S8 family peptidase n=1 Tax=Fluviicola sp. TaxID=1917219 RepID=UPI003D2BC7DF